MDLMGNSPSATAVASSLIARDLLSEQPALRNALIGVRARNTGSNFPAESPVTRAIIVAAAFVESCWLKIDSARD